MDHISLTNISDQGQFAKVFGRETLSSFVARED